MKNLLLEHPIVDKDKCLKCSNNKELLFGKNNVANGLNIGTPLSKIIESHIIPIQNKM